MWCHLCTALCQHILGRIAVFPNVSFVQQDFYTIPRCVAFPGFWHIERRVAVILCDTYNFFLCCILLIKFVALLWQCYQNGIWSTSISRHICPWRSSLSLRWSWFSSGRSTLITYPFRSSFGSCQITLIKLKRKKKRLLKSSLPEPRVGKGRPFSRQYFSIHFSSLATIPSPMPCNILASEGWLNGIGHLEIESYAFIHVFAQREIRGVNWCALHVTYFSVGIIRFGLVAFCLFHPFANPVSQKWIGASILGLTRHEDRSRGGGERKLRARGILCRTLLWRLFLPSAFNEPYSFFHSSTRRSRSFICWFQPRLRMLCHWPRQRIPHI